MTQYLKVHVMSQRTNWRTPAALYAELDREFHFTMDPCPPDPKCDGLQTRWTGVVYCNPPYGRMIGNWIRKAYYSSIEGATVVLLLPARTDTLWFHDYLQEAELRFVRGRLHFDDRRPAPFPSMIAILRGGADKPMSHRHVSVWADKNTMYSDTLVSEIGGD